MTPKEQSQSVRSRTWKAIAGLTTVVRLVGGVIGLIKLIPNPPPAFTSDSLGDRADQAVEYSLKPREPATTKIPARPAENYLRDAMVKTLAAGPRTFDFMVQVQTDSHLMPIQDATVKWPERLSPYIPVARLTLPAQRFTSDGQLAFADILRYDPWHSLPDHKPPGNSNRARRTMYYELAKLRQAMNDVQHIEPTGDEQFPD